MLTNAVNLSVAMIGRNESHCVARAVESVSRLADEIIFIDTGSLDDTREKVSALGGKVFSFTWCDDFSAARNASIDNCTGQWVLVLDCDEVVCPHVGRELIQLACSDEDEFAYKVRINSLMPDGRIESHFNIRLFRRAKEIRFSNPIHESVAEAIFEKNNQKELKSAPLEIQHQGYRSAALNKEKLIRNINILTNWVQRDKSSIYGWYKLGISLMPVNSDRAAACLYRAFELATENGNTKTLPFFDEMVGSLRVLLRETRQEALLSKIDGLLARHA